MVFTKSVSCTFDIIHKFYFFLGDLIGDPSYGLGGASNQLITFWKGYIILNSDDSQLKKMPLL